MEKFVNKIRKQAEKHSKNTEKNRKTKEKLRRIRQKLKIPDRVSSESEEEINEIE